MKLVTHNKDRCAIGAHAAFSESGCGVHVDMRAGKKMGRLVSARRPTQHVNLHEQCTARIYKRQARYVVRQNSFVGPKHVSSGFPLVFPRNGQVVDLAGQNDAAILPSTTKPPQDAETLAMPCEARKLAHDVEPAGDERFCISYGSVVLSKNATECRIGLLSTAVILLSRATSRSFCSPTKKRASVSLLNEEGVEAFTENAG